MNQVDKGHWGHQEFLVLRDHQEVQVQQEDGDHLAILVCQGLKEERDLSVVMDHLEIKVNQVHLDHLVTGALLESLDQLDLLELEDRWEHKENVVILESLARKALLAHQAFKDLMGQLVQEGKGGKRDPWGNRAHLASLVDQATKVHLAQLEAWVLLEDLDCL